MKSPTAPTANLKDGTNMSTHLIVSGISTEE